MNVSITILVMFSLVLKCNIIEVYHDIQCDIVICEILVSFQVSK